MKRTFTQITLLALTLSALSACSYRHDKGGAEGPDADMGGRSQGQAPSFAEVRARVFAISCTSCHYHGSDFKEYEPTHKALDEIRDRVFARRDMPKNSALSPEQSSLLKKWLDAGAPNDATQTAPSQPTNPVPPTTGPISPLEPTWAGLQTRFFEPHCVRCHNAENAKGDLDVTSFEQVRAGITGIFERVMVKKNMPKNRADYEKMSIESKMLVVRWIDAGMPGPVATSSSEAEDTSSP